MEQLIQLIYCSTAQHLFRPEELTDLLVKAREKNQELNVTGMLLYSDGSFFQVLEGEPETVDRLFGSIMGDERHKHVTVIIRESIPRRYFGDWTMGYADITNQEADTILGTNDFFGKGESFAGLDQGRAKKLLAAYRHGRWRSKLSAEGVPQSSTEAAEAAGDEAAREVSARPSAAPPARSWYTFAYQPIVDINAGAIFSYEALIRGLENESAGHVLGRVDPVEMHMFDEHSRLIAIELAASRGLPAHLNLNFLPGSLESSSTAISSVLDTAKRCSIRPEQIILEILEREIIRDFERFNAEVDRHRSAGMLFAIDDFGAGNAGLSLLADFQPDIVKLDMHLVRGIHSSGPRQAIVRGIVRTCMDLGIDIIAEGVEVTEEYEWFRNEGIRLFQGMLFARPEFEHLPETFNMPDP